MFLHAQYSGQINNIRLDLLAIRDWYQGKAEKATGLEAQEYRQIAKTAENLADKITGPSLNPYAYAYLNYWISSAAFTEILLSYKELGLNNETISALETLETQGWFNNQSFYIFDLAKGDYVQKLASKPKLHAYFWTYYLFVLVVAGISVWIGVKSKYDVHVVPEVICGALSLIPFWVAIFIGSLLALLLGIIQPENVPFGAYLASLIITVILSAFAGAIVGLIRKREEI